MHRSLALMTRVAIAGVLVVAIVHLAAAEETAAGQQAGKPCIAFVSTRVAAAEAAPGAAERVASGSDLFIANYDGKALINVTNNPSSRPRSPQWSPDGSTLAWLSTSGLEIFAKGSKRALVKRSDFLADMFAWSPQSDMIALYGARIEEGGASHPNAVFLADPAGSAPVKFMDLRDAATMRWANVIDAIIIGAPTGAVIRAQAESRSYSTDSRLIFRPDKPSVAIDLAASPDGSLCALSLLRDSGMRTIRVFGTNGSEAKELIESTDLAQVYPAWRPTDDNVLAFIGRTDGPWKLYLYEISAKKLSHVDAAKPYADVSSFSWSSDGKHIAVAYDHEGERPRPSAIFVLDVATMKLSQFTESSSARDLSPAWRPEPVRNAGKAPAPAVESTATPPAARVESTAVSVESTH